MEKQVLRMVLEILNGELNERELGHMEFMAASLHDFWQRPLECIAGQAAFMLEGHDKGQDCCWDCWRICQKLGFIDENNKL